MHPTAKRSTGFESMDDISAANEHKYSHGVILPAPCCCSLNAHVLACYNMQPGWPKPEKVGGHVLEIPNLYWLVTIHNSMAYTHAVPYQSRFAWSLFCMDMKH